MDDQFREAIARAEGSGLNASQQLVLHLLLCIQLWHRNGWLDQIVNMPFDDLIALARGGDILNLEKGLD